MANNSRKSVHFCRKAMSGNVCIRSISLYLFIFMSSVSFCECVFSKISSCALLLFFCQTEIVWHVHVSVSILSDHPSSNKIKIPFWVSLRLLPDVSHRCGQIYVRQFPLLNGAGSNTPGRQLITGCAYKETNLWGVFILDNEHLCRIFHVIYNIFN